MRIAFLIFSILLFPFWMSSADANDFTGTWESRSPDKSGGMLLMTIQTGNEVRFQLEIWSGGPKYNNGWIEGKFRLKGNSGIFRTSEYGKCSIKFEFTKTMVRLKEVSLEEIECGFGDGIRAIGTLKLKSRKKPEFSNGDPRHG